LVGSCIPIHTCRGLPDPKCLFDPSGLSLCLPGDHFHTLPVDDMVVFHGMVSDDRLVSYTTLLALEARGLCTGWCTERRHTSDQYLNFSSHHPLNHKLAVIRTLLERCYSKELEEDDQKKEEHVQRCSISVATLPGPLTRSNGISCRNHGRAKHRKDRIKEANTKVWLFCHM